jgi:protein TonB
LLATKKHYQMKGNKINIPDFDDLIFESRNREYGAYQLRKKYKSAVIQGLIISSFIGCSVVIIPFIIRPTSDQVLMGGNRYVSVNFENLALPVEELYLPPPPTSHKPGFINEAINNTAPVIVDTISPLEETLASAEEILASSGDTLLNENLIGYGENLLDGNGGTELTDPLFIVEVMPSFRGGDEKKFRDWVQNRAVYPEEAVNNKIKGTVMLTFVVEKDGSVSDVNIVRGVHPLLDNEALKVVSESPKWSPGLQRGQPVRVIFIIPIIFSSN